MFLLEFSVIKPAFGFMFWATVVFLIFWLFVGKLAFKPIVRALNQRADDIQTSLDAAKTAREQMSQLKAENEKIMAEARDEK